MGRLNHTNTAVRTSLTTTGGISDTDTSLDVGDSTGYPSTPFAIQIGDEVIRVDSKSGTTFSSLQRGYDGTTAASHAEGSAVKHVFIREDIEKDKVAVKSADESVSSSTTLQDDDHLSFSLLPGMYVVQLEIMVDQGDTGGVSWDYTVPGDASLSGAPTMILRDGADGDVNFAASPDWSYSTTVSDNHIRQQFRADLPTGGTIQFKWAQNSSNSTATIIRQGSSLRAIEA